MLQVLRDHALSSAGSGRQQGGAKGGAGRRAGPGDDGVGLYERAEPEGAATSIAVAVRPPPLPTVAPTHVPTVHSCLPAPAAHRLRWRCAPGALMPRAAARGAARSVPPRAPRDAPRARSTQVAVVTMAGSFLSALVGFAFALTTTSLLSNLLGSRVAQPLVAFLFLVNQAIHIQVRLNPPPPPPPPTVAPTRVPTVYSLPPSLPP
jgi:hypothetical protein